MCWMIVDIKEIFAKCQFFIASPFAAVCAVYMLTLYIVHSSRNMRLFKIPKILGSLEI